MVHAAAHVVLVTSLVAASCVLVARAASSLPSRGVSEPTVLTVVDGSALETLLEGDTADGSDGGNGSDSDSVTADADATGLFANNKIRIQDSRIVLTARDRTQLLQSIARAMVADQKKAMAADQKKLMAAVATATAATSQSTDTVPTPLVALTRDAFLYIKPSSATTTKDTDDSAATAATAAALDDLPVVRLGWRYPLAVWHTYKAFVTTAGCDVQRVIGDYFYC